MPNLCYCFLHKTTDTATDLLQLNFSVYNNLFDYIKYVAGAVLHSYKLV